MRKEQDPSSQKHIGIAIEMGQPFGHHHGTYKGILDYVRQHRPGWQTTVDPYMVGLIDSGGLPKYDGIVGRITGDAAEKADKAGIPFVNYWKNSPTKNAPCVYADSKANGRIVAEHFIEHGYKRIAMINWPTDKARPLYLAGLKEVAEQHSIEVQALDVPYGFEANPEGFVTFYKQLRETLQSVTPPIGIYIPMDAMALYVIQLCDELDIRVPDEVGLASAYNSLEVCLNTQPTLTSIEANNIKIGHEAMRLLDGLIQGDAPPTEPILVPPKTLRVRGSSQIFVCDDEVVTKAMRFIAEHAREPLSVDDVANAANVSKRTLSRRFDMHVGKSVLTEINRIRTQLIKQELVDTEQPISNVASACGFTSTSHFNVFFRKATDMTPGEYRKKHRLQA
ncbi:MAG: substrate-binding domain-containing protein [Phycisphaeraceae bacterium]|nr:substrate-binding domain-containing protein [Phycisphaeraceae bacterium]